MASTLTNKMDATLENKMASALENMFEDFTVPSGTGPDTGSAVFNSGVMGPHSQPSSSNSNIHQPPSHSQQSSINPDISHQPSHSQHASDSA